MYKNWAKINENLSTQMDLIKTPEFYDVQLHLKSLFLGKICILSKHKKKNHILHKKQFANR